ncbi:deazaflavin-dependent oxidoreductase (nitroreductase family) [Nocardia sp. GAS34]|uniref:nitroreductase family deazaflavin-dependent oxidoreductase n=1 Tax=unclassified Nocardia TaxID=2637762 RepID=UPI003D1B11FE
MTSDSSAPNPYGTPSTSGPGGPMRFQGAMNGFVGLLLRVPGLGSIVGRRLLVLHVVGRKSGKRYDIPVAYTRHEDALLIGTALHPWVKNIRKDAPVRVSMGGRPRTAAAEVCTDVETVMRLYEIIARDNRQNAGFNGIGFDASGDPNRADIYQTWQQGGAVIRLTLE